MQKWQRNYYIHFEVGKRLQNNFTPEMEFDIEYPITIEFDVQTSAFSQNNGATIRLYNLNAEFQAYLWKDNNETDKYVTMWLYAGYGDNMPLIFSGDAHYCYSYRESGGVDYITEIHADNALYIFNYGYMNNTFSKDTTIIDILKTAISNAGGVYDLGYVSPKIPATKRPKTMIGSTMDLLGREYKDYNIFVDKGELHVLGKNEVIPGQVPVITTESGLLGSPRKAGNLLSCDMIFEPGLTTGQVIEIQSETLPFMNAKYALVGLRHRGVISPVVGGQVITSVDLSIGNIYDQLQKQDSTYTGETTGGWIRPVDGQKTSGYLVKRANRSPKYRHQGIDIGANMGAPIKAPANGKIFFAGYYGGYGNCIQMDNGTIDGKKVSSLYGHLSRYNVQAGQTVKQGDIIGFVGSTGQSTGPHLHFEVKENGQNVNPEKYVRY